MQSAKMEVAFRASQGLRAHNACLSTTPAIGTRMPRKSLCGHRNPAISFHMAPGMGA